MPMSVVWLATVVAAWLVTMPLLALLIKATADSASAGSLVGWAALSATFACVVVGGPATAVALRVRGSHSHRRAVLSGLVTCAVVLLFVWSYVASTGASVAGAWKAVLPLAIVTVAEMALALRLRRYCREVESPEQAPPEQAPSRQAPSRQEPPGKALPGSAPSRQATPDQAPRDQAPPDRPEAAA